MKAGGIVIAQSGTNIDNQIDIDCGLAIQRPPITLTIARCRWFKQCKSLVRVIFSSINKLKRNTSLGHNLIEMCEMKGMTSLNMNVRQKSGFTTLFLHALLSQEPTKLSA